LHRNYIYTHLISLTGALVFLSASLPLPWLFGPMASCLIAALCGMQLRTVKLLGDGMRTILGVAVGATVTWAFLISLPSIWETLLLIPIMVMAIGVAGVWYFKRFAGYDFPTAYYASMPGGLQDMIVFGEEAGGNVRAISLIHATRVLVIVVLLPIVLTALWDVDLSRPPGASIVTFTRHPAHPPPRRGDLGRAIFHRHGHRREIRGHHNARIAPRCCGGPWV